MSQPPLPWSRVRENAAPAAVDALLLRCAPPLYGAFRRRGLAPEEALRAARAVLARRLLDDSSRPRLRPVLREAALSAPPAEPPAEAPALDAEALERAFLALREEDPGAQFDRQWTLGLLDRVAAAAPERGEAAREALWAELLATAASPVDVQEELAALARSLTLSEGASACGTCGAKTRGGACPRCLLAGILGVAAPAPTAALDDDATFGRLAVAQGLCLREQVEDCLRVIRELAAKGVRPLPRLGGLLLQKGYLGQSTTDRTVMIEAGKKAETEVRPAPAGPELPPDAEAAFAEPKNLIGKYVRVNLLGVGGMGEVWRAWDRELKRWVALKFLKYDDAKDAARFRQEAQVAAGLVHPNLCAIHEVGRHDGRPFLAMQLVEGCTLDRWPRRERHVLVRILRDAARAVAHAHRARIIHRDLKPANVMIDGSPEGRVFVMDFGLARRAEGGDGALLTREIVGTPHFMSPEQARGTGVDVRSDVYSLGATLYASLTRKTPFEASSIAGVLLLLAEKDPVRPRKLNPRIEPDLETIVLKAMEKQPERRYPTADAFADDLDRWLQGEAVEARPPGISYRVKKWLGRHRKTAAAVGITAVLAGAAFAVLIGIPEYRRAAEDHAALQAALQAKRDVERRFAQAVENGRHDEAIELARAHAGKVPALPRLHSDERADDPDYFHLRRSYDLSAARAHYERGLERLKAGDARGKGDLANAYRAGKSRTETRPLARDALLRLTERLLEEGDVRGAEGTARLAAAFGLQHAPARAGLARALQQAGSLEDAAALWHSVETDPAWREEAGRELELLRRLLPRVALPSIAGAQILGDLDQDGTVDVAVLAPDGRLRLLRPGAQDWEEAGALALFDKAAPALRRFALVDAEGRGPRDLVIAAGGEIRLVSWDEGRWKERAKGPHREARGDVVAVDLDGDGRRELVAIGGERALHVYGVEGAAIRLRAVWPMLCEVNGILPVGRDGLLVWLGEWVKEVEGEVAWRLDASDLFRVGEGKARRRWGFRIFEIGPGPGGFIRERAEAPARFIGGGWFWGREGELLVSARGGLDMRKVVPDALDGLVRVRWEGGKPAAPEKIEGPGYDWAGPPLDLGGKAHWLLRRDGVVKALPAEGGAPRRFGLAGGLTRSARWTSPTLLAGADGRLSLLGQGTYAPPPLPKPAAAGDRLMAGEVSPVQELLELGLYEEAAATAEESLRSEDDPQIRYEMGLALLSLERWDAAAAAFEGAAAERGHAGDALVRRAQALERGRKWRDLEACLERIGSTPGVDPLSRSWAAERLGWARGAGRLGPRGAWSPAEGVDTLLCDNPFRARVVAGALESWGVSGAVGDAAGLPLVYDGEGLRFTLRFRAGKLEWATDVPLGMEMSDLAGRSVLGVAGRARGATDLPVTWWSFGGSSRDGRGASAGWPGDGVTLKEGEEYVVRVEYVAGLRRAYAELLDGLGNPVAPPRTIDLPAPLERGSYLIGRIWGGDGSGDASQVSSLRILKIEVEGGEGTSFAAKAPTADLRRAAGGALVGGRAAEAASLYAKALETSDDAALRLFRALALFRDEKREAAADEARRAWDKDAAACARLLQNRAAPALTLAESGFLLRARP